jgi:hypothetical protein
MSDLSTPELYLKYQELQTLLAIAEKAHKAFVIPCEVSDEELVLAADVAAYIDEYRQELQQRANYVNKSIALRLEHNL